MKTEEANGMSASPGKLASDSVGDVIDRGLITMFLKMTPEERVQANDSAARAILELQDAFKRARQ